MPLSNVTRDFLPLRRRGWWLVAGLTLIGLLMLGAAILDINQGNVTQTAAPPAPTTHPDGPPWRYGQADARFTLTLYADLECPYCKAYYPVLSTWVERHPETVLQWHHLPLPMHEPAASQQARLAECAGQFGTGHAAFWKAVDWVYQHTRGGGAGVPNDLHYPQFTAAMRSCVDSEQSQTIVQTQASEAAHDGITATPALRLSDRETGRTLVLHGPVEGDALLSALDLLSMPEADATEAPGTTGTPADRVGDMPR